MKILKDLSEKLDIDVDDIISSYLTAPRKYKEFKIPKKRGGFRDIAQPSNEIKIFQYGLIDTFLKNFPIHDCATAYMENKSIYDNALPHKDSKYLLKLDFKDFFHSIRPEHLKFYINKYNEGISNIEIDIINNFLFWMDKEDNKLKLCIGAPSSPMISNIVMYDFDLELESLCNTNNVIYTRYADDLTLSSNSNSSLMEVEGFLNKIVERTQIPLLELNDSKRVCIGDKKSKRVTGIVITHNNQLSVGRYKRKRIRAMLHLYNCNKLNENDIPRLHGLLSFVKSIEPDYYDLLKLKYNENLLKQLAKESYIISRKWYVSFNNDSLNVGDEDDIVF
ncbi:retron St85 family RNA-directed DNA polymerase [Aliivibrio fischeri]|uniref:retron St85 family RNA-directed DNA polymerase n=1 Tax=Aliivibrio fischeri TaxID=668 RepID=UPI0007C554C0|nr:retron St85 family RNA-directed DNA polymerase [Aliivibrio fischeri]